MSPESVAFAELIRAAATRSAPVRWILCDTCGEAQPHTLTRTTATDDYWSCPECGGVRVSAHEKNYRR